MPPPSHTHLTPLHACHPPPALPAAPWRAPRTLWSPRSPPRASPPLTWAASAPPPLSRSSAARSRCAGGGWAWRGSQGGLCRPGHCRAGAACQLAAPCALDTLAHAQTAADPLPLPHLTLGCSRTRTSATTPARATSATLPPPLSATSAAPCPPTSSASAAGRRCDACPLPAACRRLSLSRRPAMSCPPLEAPPRGPPHPLALSLRLSSARPLWLRSCPPLLNARAAFPPVTSAEVQRYLGPHVQAPPPRRRR